MLTFAALLRCLALRPKGSQTCPSRWYCVAVTVRSGVERVHDVAPAKGNCRVYVLVGVLQMLSLTLAATPLGEFARRNEAAPASCGRSVASGEPASSVGRRGGDVMLWKLAWDLEPGVSAATRAPSTASAPSLAKRLPDGEAPSAAAGEGKGAGEASTATLASSPPTPNPSNNGSAMPVGAGDRPASRSRACKSALELDSEAASSCWPGVVEEEDLEYPGPGVSGSATPTRWP